MITFEKTLEKRRSIYSLGKKEVLSKAQVAKIIKHCVKHCPTAFNVQSARVVVLFGKHHEKLWNLVLETLKPLTPAKNFPNTEAKVNNCFKAGFGTVLFFEDEEPTKALQKQFPLYADNFPKWALQSNGMLEHMIWTSLAKENIGATLQHYNPVIDAKVAKEWNIPSSWKLLAQMPIGSIKAKADKKDFQSLETRVKIYK